MEPEETAIDRQRLDKHVSAAKDTHATIIGTVGKGVFYAIRASITALARASSNLAASL